MQRLGVGEDALPQRDVDLLGEDVHRHVDQHRPRASALGENERLLDDLREQVRRIHAPRPLDEGPIDLVLRRVRVQVHLLVRMLAVVVRRHVAGDHHHRDRVERGIGHAGRRVGEPGTQVRQHDRRLVRRPRVAVRRVRGDLLVPRIDELDLLALRQRREHGDVRVAAQAEDVLDAAGFEILHQLIARSGPSFAAPRVPGVRAARPAGRVDQSFPAAACRAWRRWARRGAPGRCTCRESPSASVP